MSMLKQVSTSNLFVLPTFPAAAVELALSPCFVVKEHTCTNHVPWMNLEERAS